MILPWKYQKSDRKITGDDYKYFKCIHKKGEWNVTEVFFYIRKILEGYAPKCGVEVSLENARIGRKYKIPKLFQNDRKAIQTLREQILQTGGARRFNCIPKKIREIEKDQDLLKFELDNFLSSIPDQPRVGSLVPEATCRITAWPGPTSHDLFVPF